MLTAVYSAMLSVKLCIHSRRFCGCIWEQGWQIGSGAHYKFVLGDHRGPQNPGPEAGADAAKVVGIFTWAARSTWKGKQHEVFELSSRDAAQQGSVSMLDGKNPQPLWKPYFRILHREIGWKVIPSVAISQEMRIEPDN